MRDRSFFKKAEYNNTLEISEETLNRLKGVLKDILVDVIKVAEKYKLRYILGGGSCLGAVRHKGFIPWDDDIDIMFTRKDYERFIRVFEGELGDKYLLAAPSRGKGHGMAHTQVKLKGTVYQSFNELSKTDMDDMAIFLDVFIMENTFNCKFFRKLHGVACLTAGYMLTCRKTYGDFPYLRPYIKGNKKLFREFHRKAKVGRFLKRIPLDTMARVTDKIYGLCRNNRSEYLSIPSGRGHYFKETYTRKAMLNRKLVRFESVKAYIPANYQEYLSKLYGDDYMVLPPEEKRESHPIMRLDFGIY
ncbi:MAG: LicD family protein [Clostridiales bacterium]|nr:LicD family protein [Clostridiales bacterium]MBS5877292.1 LicD family protein [Clostridiales bacterium]MDU0939134.1 LicD family protein [Clostridiales bacterium]MDU1042221.1 LicD family protein [Clostridiales bacterium]